MFFRGFVLVSLVALNTRQIAAGRYGGMFIVGGLISAVWWSNSSSKREDIPGGWFIYGLGAACGTVLGAWLGR